MNTPKHCLKPEFPEAVMYMISAADLERILRNLVNDLISEREEVKKENYLVPVRIGNKLRYKESEVKQLMEGK